MSQRRTPMHVSIPAGASAPHHPNPSARQPSPSPYPFEERPAGDHSEPLYNPWDVWDISPPSPGTAHPNTVVQPPSRPASRNRTTSLYAGGGYMPFPEPQLYRSVSERPSVHNGSSTPGLLHPNHNSVSGTGTGSVRHRHSRSEMLSPSPPSSLRSSGSRLRKENSSISLRSTASSYYEPQVMPAPRDSYDESYHSQQSGDDEFAAELSNLSLVSEEGLRKFQSGELPEKDQEWYKLVPPEAREALGKEETQRQSVTFEIFKGEQEYVQDLQAVKDVYIQPLRKSNPPIIPVARLDGFIAEVFANLDEILGHHKRMLEALFTRQREQHPLIYSIADIILDTTLQSSFRTSYETYIKHYPIAESRHRTELARNPAYSAYITSVSSDPRIRKRDLVTFLSRPVTRLPRLNLVLEQILKLTTKIEESNSHTGGGEGGHEDLGSLPITLGILRDCIKSTQPGIEAAQKKVDFWKIAESLVFQKGEIIDMDLYDDSRTLVHAGPLARRNRDSEWSGFVDLNVCLLDNFLLLTKEETRPNGTLKRHLMSRPLSLWYLRMGDFKSPPETRKEKAVDGRLLQSLRYETVPVFPFTVYHASNKSNRRYTLYAATEAIRQRWHTVLIDAIGVNKVRGEANMWFNPNVLNDTYFRIVQQPGQPFMGRITSASPFSSGGRRLVAVGCATGIYVGFRGESNFHKVFKYANPTNIAAIEGHDKKLFSKFIVHFDGALFSYPLDLVARVFQGLSVAKELDASREKIAGKEGAVLFFRPTLIAGRMLIIYGSKRTLQSGVSINALEVLDTTVLSATAGRTSTRRTFRLFGETGYLPKDAFDVATLVKSVGVCTSDGIVIFNPTNLATSVTTRVPDFANAQASLPMTTLKEKLEKESTKPLGLVRVEGSAELLVIYDTLGCYITKHGDPSRSCGYIKWDSRVTSFAQRGVHVLLFSPQFIEIRDITTGRLVQVIEGSDVRLLYGPRAGGDTVALVAMRAQVSGAKESPLDKVVELVETFEIASPDFGTSAAPSPSPGIWDEWDVGV